MNFSYTTAAAHNTPTSYSDDIRSPFRDLGMRGWSDNQLREYFAGRRILDVGSGFEGFARRMHVLFANHVVDRPLVVNLNPQFTDWRIAGKDTKRYKRDDILAGMRDMMQQGGEDFAGYSEGRLAVAGLVQNLPFRDQAFDRVVSTWGFPTCLYDCGGDIRAHSDGYAEVLRVLDDSGEARLGPIGLSQQTHAVERLEAVQGIGSYAFAFSAGGDFGDVLQLAHSSELIS